MSAWGWVEALEGAVPAHCGKCLESGRVSLDRMLFLFYFDLKVASLGAVWVAFYVIFAQMLQARDLVGIRAIWRPVSDPAAL